MEPTTLRGSFNMKRHHLDASTFPKHGAQRQISMDSLTLTLLAKGLQTSLDARDSPQTCSYFMLHTVSVFHFSTKVNPAHFQKIFLICNSQVSKQSFPRHNILPLKLGLRVESQYCWSYHNPFQSLKAKNSNRDQSLLNTDTLKHDFMVQLIRTQGSELRNQEKRFP